MNTIGKLVSTDEAKAALTAAEDAYKSHNRLRNIYVIEQSKRRVEPLMEKAELERIAINKEAIQRFEEKSQELREAEWGARLTYDTALAKEIEQDTGWLPVGTKIVEWKFPRWYGLDRKLTLSGKVGMVEVFSRDSVCPENMTSWKRPEVGTVIARHVKKDGSPAKTFESNGWSIRNRWFAEGVDPNITPYKEEE